MDGNDMDDRYVGFREHAAAMQRTDAELARLRERQATTEATLLHEVAGVRQDVSEMKQMMLRPDHSALATHRVLDELPNTLSQTLANALNNSGAFKSTTSPLLLAFAIIGAVAIGALGVVMFTGIK